MSAYRIVASNGVLNFELWRGPPPGLVHERVQGHTRPGADGVGQQKLGRYGVPFEATLTADFNSHAKALATIPLLQSLIGAGPIKLVYDTIDYAARFRTAYLVDEAEPLSCKAHVRLRGPGYNYAPGSRLVVRVVMTPVAV